MNNTNDYNKNREDASSPEKTKTVAKVKNRSKHRINYFDWTIRLIQEMLCLQINSMVLKLKEVSVTSKKSGLIKNLQFHIRKSGSFLKKKTNVKKSVLLMEALLLLFFTYASLPNYILKIRNTGCKTYYHHSTYSISREPARILLKEITRFFSSG